MFLLAFNADRKALCEAIAAASQGLSSRPQNPVHAGMLVTLGHENGFHDGSVALTASDGWVTFRSLISASHEEDGSFILPGKLLGEISRYFTGDSVSLESEGSSVTLISGKSRFTLSSTPGEEYPGWSKSPEPLGKLDAGAFSDAVKSVAVAAKRDHPVQRGMRLAIEGDRLLMTATDGSRMAFASPQLSAVTLKTDAPVPILAPAAVLDR